MMMNTANATTPRTSRTITIGDDHGNEEPPLEMGTRINVVATILTKAPAKSTFFNLDLKDPVTGFNGSRKNI
jgi:hypothetical protein